MALTLVTETNPGVAYWGTASGGGGGINFLVLAFGNAQDLTVWPPVYTTPFDIAVEGGALNGFAVAAPSVPPPGKFDPVYFTLPVPSADNVGKTYYFALDRSIDLTTDPPSILIVLRVQPPVGFDLYQDNNLVPFIELYGLNRLYAITCEDRTPPGGPPAFAWHNINRIGV